jgi:hypothetical protein
MADLLQAAAAQLLTVEGAVMWRINRQGEREFTGGTEEWQGAARIAATCPAFHPDVEEEQVADEARSCYNCRYRRWSGTSFTCCAPAGGRNDHNGTGN